MLDVKIALITNLCSHYRYKLYKMLTQVYGVNLYFFDNPEKTKEDIKLLKIYKDEKKFHYLPTKKILIKLLKEKYDVVIKCTNNKWSFFGSLLVSKLIKAKFIVWHSIWYYPKTLQYKLFSRLLIKILKDYTDAIVVYGKNGANFLEKKGIISHKIFIAWQTVDNETFGRKIKNDEIRKIKDDFNITKNKKIILYVGRFAELKGIEYLLKALNKLDKDKFIFITIGYGILKDKIETFCKNEHINHRSIGIIPYDNLPPYYKMSNLLILPSITTKSFKEPWGLVVNEAFNQGCPVIVTEAVGAAHGGLVKDGINGFIVPEKNSESLARAINFIINDEASREILSKNAKEEIKDWTYKRQANGFLDAVRYAMRR